MKHRKKFISILIPTILFLISNEIYPQAGQLDPSFGKNGIVITALNFQSYAILSSIGIQTNGKIIAAGYTRTNAGDDFALVRYNKNGSLDNNFGKDGIAITPISIGDDIPASVAIQIDGKIIAAGHSNNGSHDEFALVRYSQDGSLDNTFGTGGIVTTDIGIAINFATSVTIQDNGKVLAAGYTVSSLFSTFAIARYKLNGDLDSTFGSNGIVMGTTNSSVSTVLMQSNGKILVVGEII